MNKKEFDNWLFEVTWGSIKWFAAIWVVIMFLRAITRACHP